MNILVYIENWNGSLKKASFEAAAYANDWAKSTGGEAFGVVINGASIASDLPLNTVYNIDIPQASTERIAAAILAAKSTSGAQHIVLSSSTEGRSILPMVAAKGKMSAMSNALSLPEMEGETMKIKRKVFSNKAFGYANASASQGVVIGFTPNSYAFSESTGSANVETISTELPTSGYQAKSEEVASGGIPLPEAEYVVSAGRGLKGPENWNMIEELAHELKAGTACSKPVSDLGWRPHHEHVGQTGIAINPELYIAIGISGAIQHLAGVSSSKNIVVINKDPEAPFFKAADYGIVGDAFEIVPKLIEEIKKHKAANA